MEDPLVTVQEGVLRGKYMSDLLGDKFYSFQGIPYAKPPLGKLRFKAPRPPEKWEGIRDATADGNKACIKKGESIIGSEDCLFLNVFTKEIETKVLKPVMVWVHSGGFTQGSSHSEMYGPEYLLVQDIVLVTFNYRLGILGFLCFEDSSLGVPGNAGLKDVIMTLKWVQKNIKVFSGDPDNVTVFGESAGGAAAHYLMFSPMSKGLFHKVIAQSGSALNMFPYGSRSISHLLTKAFGIRASDEKEMLEHLQQLTTQELLEGASGVKNTIYIGQPGTIGAVIEKPSAEPAFLSEDPLTLIKSGRYHKVPLIMGYCDREGIFIYGRLKNMGSKYILCDESLVPLNMNLKRGSHLYNFVVSCIKLFYFKGKNPLNNIDNILKLYRDNYFLLEIYNSAVHHLETNNYPTYFYKFSLDTSLNYGKAAYSMQHPGASHADDIFYLFSSSLYRGDSPLSSEETAAIQRVTKMWANFAKYGNPTPEKFDALLPVIWKPIADNEFNYLHIGETLELKTNPEKEAMNFWNGIKLISKTKL